LSGNISLRLVPSLSEVELEELRVLFAKQTALFPAIPEQEDLMVLKIFVNF